MIVLAPVIKTTIVLHRKQYDYLNNKWWTVIRGEMVLSDVPKICWYSTSLAAAMSEFEPDHVIKVSIENSTCASCMYECSEGYVPCEMFKEKIADGTTLELDTFK